MAEIRWIFPKKCDLAGGQHAVCVTDYFKLSALTLFGLYQLRGLKKGRGEQVVFTTIGKPIWCFGAFVARNP